MSDETKSGHLHHTDLAKMLSAEIQGRKYAIGDRFPTEIELQERFGVGRHTVREALKILSEKGMLGRRQKTGTVVLSKRPVSSAVHSIRDIHNLLDFATNTVLEVKYEGYISNLSSAVTGFADDKHDRWYRVAGLRSWRVGNEPLCWSEIIVPEEYWIKRIPGENVSLEQSKSGKKERAIYERLMDVHGLKLGYVEQDVSAVALPMWMASTLQAEPRGAALLLKRRYVTSQGSTFEISHNYYPSGRYALRSIIRQRE